MGGYASNNFTIKDGGINGDERFTIVDGTGKNISMQTNEKLDVVGNFS